MILRVIKAGQVQEIEVPASAAGVLRDPRPLSDIIKDRARIIVAYYGGARKAREALGGFRIDIYATGKRLPGPTRYLRFDLAWRSVCRAIREAKNEPQETHPKNPVHQAGPEHHPARTWNRPFSDPADDSTAEV
jgi:hypothetical protein